MVRQRVRIRFRKEGDLRLISHRDLLRTLERLFRRAALRLSMSEGFHPKPRMSFPLALAVGIAGADEVMELELAEETTGEQVAAALAPHLPPGLVLNSVEVLPPGAPKAAVRRVTFEVPVPAERHAAVRAAIERVLAASALPVEREGGKGRVDIRPSVETIELVDGSLRMHLRVSLQGTARPREILAALGLADLEPQGLCLTRTAVELET